MPNAHSKKPKKTSPTDKPSPKVRRAPLARKPGSPLHLQAETRLRALIAEERFTSGGELLTDEVTLSKKWGISRNTLRHAIARLVTEGRLRRVAGFGTRVLPAPVRSDVSAWVSFSREMRDRGIVVKTFAADLKKEVPPPDIAADLGLQAGESAWRLRRVRGWNEQPAIFAESWLHPRVPLSGNEDFQREPLYELLQQVGQVAPAQSQEEIHAVSAPVDIAQALEISEGTPLLLRRRRILDAQGTPLELNLNWCRNDRYTLTLTLRAN